MFCYTSSLMPFLLLNLVDVSWNSFPPRSFWCCCCEMLFLLLLLSALCPWQYLAVRMTYWGSDIFSLNWLLLKCRSRNSIKKFVPDKNGYVGMSVQRVTQSVQIAMPLTVSLHLTKYDITVGSQSIALLKINYKYWEGRGISSVDYESRWRNRRTKVSTK